LPSWDGSERSLLEFSEGLWTMVLDGRFKGEEGRVDIDESALLRYWEFISIHFILQFGKQMKA
jgi:hypothetical protein